MPLFSVIIPVFNRADILRSAIDSIHNQEDRDFELICVDDGSTDASVDVVRSYGDRVRLIEQTNAGPSVARNRGVAAARGEYIAFLDSDDRFFPWTLATYRSVIESNHRPAIITGSPVVFTDKPPDVRKADVQINRYKDYLDSGSAWRWFGVSSFVIRRDVYQSVGGFDARWRGSEDSDLMLRIGTAAGFIQVVSPHTFAYLEHPTSLKSELSRALAGNWNLIENEQAGRYPGGPDRAKERRRIITRHVRPFTLHCLAHGRTEDASRMYRATRAWHLAEGRFKYLLGFPIKRLLSRGKHI